MLDMSLLYAASLELLNIESLLSGYTQAEPGRLMSRQIWEIWLITSHGLVTATELVFSMGMALFTGSEQTSPVSLTQNIHLNLYSSLVGQGDIDTGNTWNVTVWLSPRYWHYSWLTATTREGVACNLKTLSSWLEIKTTVLRKRGTGPRVKSWQRTSSFVNNLQTMCLTWDSQHHGREQRVFF